MTDPDADLRDLRKDLYASEDLRSLFALLSKHKTFAFAPLASGLYPAAAAGDAHLKESGYGHVWVRDNVHVANAALLSGDAAAADRCVLALAAFFWRYRDRFLAIVEGRVDPENVGARPPIRFNGGDLSEAPGDWPHAQNDALGLFLWFYCRRAAAGAFKADFALTDLFVAYFERIAYWRDADSGHWEEERKIEASSIGAVYAGLLQLRAVRGAGDGRLEALIEAGAIALMRILPAESIGPPPLPVRRYDAALLFLIYPLDVAPPAMAERICSDVTTQLQGEHGVRRYLGDSYWTADYKRKLTPDLRSADFSQRLAERDALHRAGEEAQWCLFDPILSIIAGRRYLQHGSVDALREQTFRFNRALSQLTDASWSAGPLQCPEAYCLEDGRYVPNPQTPLLWTQANLLSAFVFMQKTAAAREGAAG